METNLKIPNGFKNIAVPSVAVLSKDDLKQVSNGVEPKIDNKQICPSFLMGVDHPNLEKGPDSVSKFFSKLFEARQMAHIFHLQVNGQPGSGWEHTALGDFYEKLLEFTDDIIETYQGQYGIVEGYEMIDTSATRDYNSLKYLQSLVEFIKKERYNCLSEEDSHLQNIVDEIVALVYKTIYKLTYMK